MTVERDELVRAMFKHLPTKHNRVDAARAALDALDALGFTVHGPEDRRVLAATAAWESADDNVLPAEWDAITSELLASVRAARRAREDQP